MYRRTVGSEVTTRKRLNDIEEWLVNPNQRCLLVNSLPTLLVLETSNKRMSQVRHLFHEAVDTSK